MTTTKIHVEVFTVSLLVLPNTGETT